MFATVLLPEYGYLSSIFSLSSTGITKLWSARKARLAQAIKISKISIFWDITACSPLKVNWRFRGTGRHHLHACFFAWLIPRAWRWSRCGPPKRQLAFSGLQALYLHNHRCENLRSYNQDSIIPASEWRRIQKIFGRSQSSLLKMEWSKRTLAAKINKHLRGVYWQMVNIWC
jgi:hypothetical protein